MRRWLSFILLFLVVTYPLMSTIYINSNQGFKGNLNQSQTLNVYQLEENKKSGYLRVIEDIEKMNPISLTVEEGKIIEGSLYSLYSDNEYIKLSSISNKLVVYFKFNFGGRGSIYIKGYRSDGASIIVYYYDLEIGKFVPLGYCTSEVQLNLPKTAIDNSGNLIIKLTGIATAEYNMTIYKLTFDPANEEKMIQYLYEDEKTISINFEPRFVPTKLIFLNLSMYWRFSWCNQEIKWDYKERSIKITKYDKYTFIFRVEDAWMHEETGFVRINLFDSSGEPVDPMAIKVYYRDVKLRTNESIWAFKRVYKIKNPLAVDLYNVSIEITLNETNFNFFRVNENLSDILFVYRGNKTYHVVKEWDGTNAVLSVKIPIIEAKNESDLIMYYGLKNGSSKNSGFLGFYYIDISNATNLKDWNIIRGEWNIEYIDDVGDYFLVGRPGNIQPFIFFNHKLPLQIRVNLEFHVNVTPMEIHLVFTDSSSATTFYYYRVIIIDDSTNSYALITALYRNDSGSITKLTDYKSTVVTSPKKLFNVSYVITDIFTSININGGANNYYEFPQPLNNWLKLGFKGNDSETYVGKLHILNYYDGKIEGLWNKQDDFNNIIYMFGEYNRVFSNLIYVNGSNLVNILIKDTFNQTLLNETIGVAPLIKFKLNISELNVVALKEFNLANVDFRVRNSSYTYAVRPLDSLKIYLGNGSNIEINVTYSNSNDWLYLNLTINQPKTIYLTGLTIEDLYSLLNSMDRTIDSNFTGVFSELNALKVKVDAVDADILRLFGRFNDTADKLYNKTMSIYNFNVEMQDKISELQDNLTYIKFELSRIKTNITNVIAVVTNTSDMVNESYSLIGLVNYTLTSSNISLNRILKMMLQLNLTIFNLTELVRGISTSFENLNNTLSDFQQTIYTTLNITIEKLSKINSSATLLVTKINQTIKGLTEIMNGLNKTYIDLHGDLNSLSENITQIRNETETIKSQLTKLGFLSQKNLEISEKILGILSSLNKTIISKLNIMIELVNSTLKIWISDQLSQMKNEVILVLNDTMQSLQQLIYAIQSSLLDELKVKTYRLIEKFTGHIVQSNIVYMTINGYKVEAKTTVTTVGSTNIRVLDYWGRELPFNLTNGLFIDVIVGLGKLIVLNNRMGNVIAKIRPVEILDKYYSIIVGGLNYISLELPYGKYVVEIYNANKEKISENTIEIKENFLAKKSTEVTITISQENSNSGIIRLTDTGLLTISSATVSLLVLYLIYKRKQAIKELELDEELDEI